MNFLEYWERRSNGKEQHFAWVSDLPIEESTVMEMMRAGRARWRIENETFNTLKNQGYRFEHNFGHGHKHLATVFAYLMMLAFLIDQVRQRGCTLFAKARVKAERPRYFWDKSLPPSPIGGAQAVPDLPRGGLGDVVPGDCVRIPGRDGAL